MKKAYLDNTAGTPVVSEVKEAMLPYFEEISRGARQDQCFGTAECRSNEFIFSKEEFK